MNKTKIKQIKSMYSAKIHSKNPQTATPEIGKGLKKSNSRKTTFFNGVIDKLNIVVTKD
jgi:hypothetical protein